ncbi:MAG TPA: 50S ribosomal protein L4 [Candidatus Saccharimonadales bacterium]|nr:50S ribosomal protein L4 [Candidatus Saccharimonadales bacterium]
MASAKLFTSSGDSSGTVELPAALFDAPCSEHVVYEALKAYLANQRQGTHSVKHRHDMKGGGTKPWRQKGTGRARAGSNISPLWVGGARAFGPVPRDYGYRVPRGIRRAAIRGVLTRRAKEEAVVVMEALAPDSHRTKEFAALLGRLGVAGRKTLVVTQGVIHNAVLASRNLPGVDARPAHQLTAYDLVSHDALVVTRDALQQLNEVFAS